MPVNHRTKTASMALAAILSASFGTVAIADSTDTEATLNRHLAAFGAGDVPALLADYTDTSVLMTTGAKMTGPEEMKPAFEALVAEFSKPGAVFEMQHVEIVDNVAYIVWNAETADNTYQIGTDTFVVEDGKIISQTFTALAVPKN